MPVGCPGGLLNSLHATDFTGFAPVYCERMARTTVPLAPYEDDLGNRIEYDGPGIDNVHITFRGRNNVARIAKDAYASYVNVDFNSNNGSFALGGNPGRRSFAASVRVGEDATVLIADDVSAASTVTISAVEGVRVSIGRDVMFAGAVQVRADDGHPIFDVRSGLRVNPASSIRIGEHVWIGHGCMIMPGAGIADGSVIGAGSVVTSLIPNNAMAAGVPATVVRRDIAWERPHLGLVAPYYKPDSSTVEKSAYWHLTDGPGGPVTRGGRLGERLGLKRLGLKRLRPERLRPERLRGGARRIVRHLRSRGR